MLTSHQRAQSEARLPVWACIGAILSLSGSCYWLIFKVLHYIAL